MLEIFGGPDRDRTDDLFHAMEARSQLRHRPTLRGCNCPIVSAGAGFVKPTVRCGRRAAAGCIGGFSEALRKGPSGVERAAMAVHLRTSTSSRSFSASCEAHFKSIGLRGD